jgi:hypothetical protein
MAGKRLGKEKALADLNEKERDGAGRGVGGVLAVLAVLRCLTVRHARTG